MAHRSRRKRNTIIEETDTDIVPEVAAPSSEVVAPETTPDVAAPETVPDVPTVEFNGCILCHNDFKSDDKKTEFTCGCYTVHTNCALKFVAENAMFYLRNRIPTCNRCNEILYNDGLDEEEDTLAFVRTPPDNTNITLFEALKSKKDSLKDIKKVKANKAALNKATKEFKKKLKEKTDEFKAQAEVHIIALKLLKRVFKNDFSQCVEYKDVLSKGTVHKSSLTRFKKKYNVDFVERKRSYWRSWRNRPAHILKWSFRIRI